MTNPLGPLELRLDEQLQHARRYLQVAQQFGFFLSVFTRVPEKQKDGRDYKDVRFPEGMSDHTAGWARTLYDAWCDEHRKRPFHVYAATWPRRPGEPMVPALVYLHVTVPDRVSMRALNAPMQLLVGDVPKNAKQGTVGAGRLVYARKESDGFRYWSSSPAGAQAMWTILVSEPVQRMLHHKDHYSRARRAGED